MVIDEILLKVEKGFSDYYPHFKEFQQNDDYSVFWDKCIASIADRDFLVCLIFCNDVFEIPPVKTFLTRYREDFVRMTGDKRAKLDTFTKRAIGAFWGMVFKFVLGYTEQKSVSISMNEYFMVKTASVYSGKGNVDIE